VIQSPSGKYRVGLTRNFRQRFYCYQSSARTGRKENTHWINAMRKYGWSSMRIGILPLPKEQRSETEQLFIWLLKADNQKFGYNKTSGGESSFEHTPETKAKMKAIHNTPEVLARHSAAATLTDNRPEIKTAFLKRMSSPEVRKRRVRGQNKPESKAKLSMSLKAAWSSPELKEKQRIARTASFTPERRAAISLSSKKQWTAEKRARQAETMHNKTVSDATRSACRQAQRTRALKIAKYVMFNGVPTLLSDVAKELGISNSGAHARLKRGKLQLAKSPTDIQ